MRKKINSFFYLGLIYSLMAIVRDLFPSFSETDSKSIVESLKQFHRRKLLHNNETTIIEEELYLQITKQPIQSFLAQGDIIRNVPFHFVDHDGYLRKLISQGMILSATCDIENDENILIAPCFSLTNFNDLDINRLMQNLYYKFICLNNSSIPDNCLVVDLSMITSFSKKLIQNRVSVGLMEKQFSLTLIGYYLLLLKLTVHLLRPEDQTASKER